MSLLLFLCGGLPVFAGWIVYRLYFKKESYPAVKDALFTGLFCFALLGGVIYFLS